MSGGRTQERQLRNLISHEHVRAGARLQRVRRLEGDIIRLEQEWEGEDLSVLLHNQQSEVERLEEELAKVEQEREEVGEAVKEEEELVRMYETVLDELRLEARNQTVEGKTCRS